MITSTNSCFKQLFIKIHSLKFIKLCFHLRLNDFAQVLKNLARYTDLKIILLNHENNYVGNSSIMSKAVKNLDVLEITLSILYNYFDCPTKFSDLYLVKLIRYLDKSKPFFLNAY